MSGSKRAVSEGTKETKAKKRGRNDRLLLRAAVLLFLFFLGGLLAEVALGLLYPYPVQLLTRHGESTRVLAADGSTLRVTPTVKGERLIRLELEDVSVQLINALIAAEDKRFHAHGGVDFIAFARAIYSNITAGRIVSGASTLSMQVARMIEPRRRSLWSKAKEMFRARQLERLLTKNAILALYLNIVPWGGTLRGVEAASLYWFGKHAKDLALSEAAMLVAMLPAPSRRSPRAVGNRLMFYRNRVLGRMRLQGSIDRQELSRARGTELIAHAHSWPFLAPHGCELAMRERAWRAGQGQGVLHTSIDPGIQKRIQAVVKTQKEAIVDGLAVVVLSRDNGAVLGVLGSRDYRSHPLNAANCRRCVGSTLKPFLYALAEACGVTAVNGLLLDKAQSFGNYRPGNYTRDYVGRIRTAEALRQSRNLPAVSLLDKLGVDRFRDVLKQLGLPVGYSPLHLDLALGTIVVSPLELARAYWRFATEDFAIDIPWEIRARILDVLRQHSPAPAILGKGRVAWKTGTSSGRRDAWTVGVTDRHVVLLWLGNLDGRGASGLVGGEHAARLFAGIVAVLEGA